MKAVPGGVVITILGKDYTVACPPDEQEALSAAARHLDQRMRAIQEAGKVVGVDRCAVVAGLNLANELLELRQQDGGASPELGKRLEALGERITRYLESELEAG